MGYVALSLCSSRGTQRSGHGTPVAGSKLLGKKSRFSELFLVLLVSKFCFTVFNPRSCGGGFINSPLQSWVNQCFVQIFEWLFSKKKPEKRSPRGWDVNYKNLKEIFDEMSCVHFMRLLGLLWHYLKKFEDLRILRTSLENRSFFRSCNW